MVWQLNFLGVGGGGALGCSSAVLSKNNSPQLLIDCGYDTLDRYQDHYQSLPEAVYISHLHLDHIAGLEQLFYRAYFNEELALIKLFVAANLVPQLCERIANYPGQLAEAGANFWDCFQLIPVNQGFWHNNNYFAIYPTRHHQPNTSFALHLAGVFFYSGDTRPIPEIIHHYCTQDETIFHDCSVIGNPSHSGIDDIIREYRQDILQRLFVYHYHHSNERQLFLNAGLQSVEANIAYDLPLSHQFTNHENHIKLA